MIVLDTHTLIWWLKDSEKLSTKAKKEILNSKKDGDIYISSISIWEIACLVKKKKLDFKMDLSLWVNKLEKTSWIHFVSVDNEVALRSVFLSGIEHKDPADRIIIATAQALDCPIVTIDPAIRNYGFVKTIW